MAEEKEGGLENYLWRIIIGGGWGGKRIGGGGEIVLGEVKQTKEI